MIPHEAAPEINRGGFNLSAMTISKHCTERVMMFNSFITVRFIPGNPVTRNDAISVFLNVNVIQNAVYSVYISTANLDRSYPLDFASK